MACIIIAEVVADDAIRQKIRDKHPPLAFETVRQALIYAKDVPGQSEAVRVFG